MAGLAGAASGKPPSSTDDVLAQTQSPSVGSDPAILIVSLTPGYRHGSIPAGNQAIKELGDKIAEESGAEEVRVDLIDSENDTTPPTEFPTDVEELNQYDVLVFNSSNDANPPQSTETVVLNEEQADAFEEYIRSGGGFVGIHSAVDNQTDGSFFNGMFQTYYKDHPDGTQHGQIHVTDRVHPSTKNLPLEWNLEAEWYNFTRNPRGNVHVLCTADESTYDELGYDGGEMEGTDHPISWCQNVDGGRAWYTGLGHLPEQFEDETFREHLLGGIMWAAGYVDGEATGTIWDTKGYDQVVGSLTDPTAMAVTDDGQVFFTHGGTNREVSDEPARISVYDPETESVSEALSFDIYTGENTGLFGLELDPDFTENGWVYLQYAPLGESVNRISRFTYSDGSIDLSTEKQLLDVDTQRETCCHAGGDMQFGPDGRLYIATGDDTNPFHSSGYAPIDEREGRKYYDAQRTAGNTADLRGSILRIEPQDDGSYTIPEDNLFTETNGYGDEIDNGLVRPEIYVLGCRNPFRLHVDSKTGHLWYSDYGPDADAWDAERGPPGIVEFNRVSEAHFSGWPYFVGPNIPFKDYDFETETANGAFDPENPTNNSPNNTGLTDLPPAREATIYYPANWSALVDDVPDYAQDYLPEEPPFPEVEGGAPMVGPVYRNQPEFGDDALSEYYDGKYFMMEYNRGWIQYVTFDDDGEVLEIEPFMSDTNFGINWEMETAPDGSIYHMDFTGSVNRITGGSLSAASVSIGLEEDSLQPGQSTTGTITIRNISENDLSDVEISVASSEEKIQVTPSSQTAFDSIAPGESKSVEYEVNIGSDAAQGSYDVETEVSFAYEGENRSVSSSVSVSVSDPQASDQYFWQASEYEAGTQPDTWKPKANVEEWGIKEDDDGAYLGLEGSAEQRTSLRFTEPDKAVEMEVWARAKSVDESGDYWVYGRGYGEDKPQADLTAARADDYIVENQFRLSAYDNGNLAIGESVDHVGADELYEVRLQVSGNTMRARWWPTSAEEPNEWDLEGSAPTEEPGYAGLGHWIGESYQIYAFGVGVGGAAAPTSQLSDQPPAVVGDSKPTDPDGDGLYEDVNGDGEANYDDIVDLFDNYDDSAVQDNAYAYDFNDNGNLDFDDIVEFFRSL
ncbi:ThuA domain-containing protein [Haladaptatus sp. DYF46]|uniref:ThuA domain-containing protein n=1 Tax=Haladaptatus sp. DYF46 TaxID=2886041 RepID=UPI001E658315|nr:ThuA domain-containing protein [Haladaptatus sp. DYF46]